MGNEWIGPIYGVALLRELPLDGGMIQALPSRSDLNGVRNYRQGHRVVAGYEVVLEHYRRETEQHKQQEDRERFAAYCRKTALLCGRASQHLGHIFGNADDVVRKCRDLANAYAIVADDLDQMLKTPPVEPEVSE